MKKIKLKIKSQDLKKKLGLKDGYTPIKGLDYFDGISPDKNEIVDEVKKAIPKPEIIAQQIPIRSEEIRDSLELLTGEDRLDKSAIRGLDEFAKKGDIGGGSTARYFYQLYDVPQTYKGQASKLLQVNASETALEFTNSPTVVDWDEIGGTQSDVNVGGFTNNVGYITATTGASTFLLLDQTTPQTVINGAPTFVGGLLAGTQGVTGYADIGNSGYGGYFSDPSNFVYLANGTSALTTNGEIFFQDPNLYTNYIKFSPLTAGANGAQAQYLWAYSTPMQVLINDYTDGYAIYAQGKSTFHDYSTGTYFAQFADATTQYAGRFGVGTFPAANSSLVYLCTTLPALSAVMAYKQSGDYAGYFADYEGGITNSVRLIDTGTYAIQTTGAVSFINMVNNLVPAIYATDGYSNTTANFCFSDGVTPYAGYLTYGTKTLYIGNATYILQATGNSSFDGSAVFNDSGADKDFRIEGDTLANLFNLDASADAIGINNASPSALIDIVTNATTKTGLTIKRIANQSVPAFNFLDATGTYNRFEIDGDGRLLQIVNSNTDTGSDALIANFRMGTGYVADAVVQVQNSNATQKAYFKANGYGCTYTHGTDSLGGFNFIETANKDLYYRVTGTGRIYFQLGGSERVRFDENGHVGINFTPVADAMLTIKNSNDASYWLLKTVNDNGNTNSIFTQTGSGDFAWWGYKNGSSLGSPDIALSTAADCYFRSQKVGIGNAAPGAQLEVDTTVATNIGLLIKGYTSQSANLFEVQKSDATVIAKIDGTDGSMAVGGTTLTKTGSGGTLQVNSTNHYATLRLKSDNSDWGFFTTSDAGFIFRQTTGVFYDPFSIKTTAPTNSLVLATTGVGILTDSPSAGLHILKTTEQLRLGYDANNYFSTTVASTGSTTFNLVASSGTPVFNFSDGIYVNGVSRIGDGGTTNYTEFEADGSLTMVGTATVFQDVNTGFAGAKVPAANAPTWTTFIGNINAYTFAVDNYIDVEALEVPHGWKEGSDIEIHIHWATNGNNDATVRGVKWEVEYTWANMLSAGGTTAFGSIAAVSTETSIAANEPTLTHKYTSVLTFTPTGGKVGMYIKLRLKRIASVTNTAPANNPFGLAVGIHCELNRIGSRTSSAA